MSVKEERLKKLEDEFYAKLQPLEARKKRSVLERIKAETALLTSYDFDNDEATFLKSITGHTTEALSNEKLLIVCNSLSVKVAKSTGCDTCSSWAVRCAYSLLLHDPLIDELSYISDQMKIIFNAAFFCNVTIAQLENIILHDG